MKDKKHYSTDINRFGGIRNKSSKIVITNVQRLFVFKIYCICVQYTHYKCGCLIRMFDLDESIRMFD